LESILFEEVVMASTAPRLQSCPKGLSDILEESRLYMSPFQQRVADKNSGEFTSQSRAESARDQVREIIMAGLLDSIPKKLKQKFPGDPEAQLEYLLNIVKEM
jgi:hypothetical protein